MRWKCKCIIFFQYWNNLIRLQHTLILIDFYIIEIFVKICICLLSVKLYLYIFVKTILRQKHRHLFQRIQSLGFLNTRDITKGYYPPIKLSNFGGANSIRLMSAFAFISLKRVLSSSRYSTRSIICCLPFSKGTINPLLPSSTNS